MDKRRAGLIALGIIVAAGLLAGGVITFDQWSGFMAGWLKP